MAKRYKSEDGRLCCVLDTARHVLQYYREERMRIVRHFAGNRFSPNSVQKKTYVNLISLYISIVSRNLISKNPRVLLSTFDLAQKPAVTAAETWMNRELVRQDFAATMQRIVLDGLISVGVAKCCLATPMDAAVQGWGLQAGQPFLSRIDLDDLVYDHRARDFAEVQFIGHRYRAPFEVVRNFEFFNKKAREKIEVSYQISHNRQGDERIGEIGRDYHGYDEDLYDMVDLWEVYLPQERVVKTYCESDLSGPSSANEGGKPICLREQEWIGPDYGPYPILAYQVIPGNIHPKGPVLDLVDLHEMANEGYRKLGRQFARLKKITAFAAHNPADGESVRNSQDGATVGMLDPKSVSEVISGGGDAGLFNWVRENIMRFMEQAGNLLTLGGLAPQAGTLGQEELLAQQSNGQVASMQDTTVSFVSKCADAMLWYYWNDPRLQMKAPLDDPQLPDVQYTRTVYPWNQQGPANLLRRGGEKPTCKIDPYSMRHTTPQQRVKDLLSVVTGIYLPLAGLFEKQGIILDLNEMLSVIGKNIDAPDLQRIMTMAGQATSGEENSSPSPGGQTEHVSTRRSIGGQSKIAQNMEMDNELAAQMSGDGSMNGSTNGQY